MIRIFFILAFLIVPVMANADPYLVSDPNSSAEPGAVIQLEIDGVVDSTLYAAESDGSVKIDVQIWEGSKNIRSRLGNPWAGLAGKYKWSDWGQSASPFTYPFPVKGSPFTNLRIE